MAKTLKELAQQALDIQDACTHQAWYTRLAER